MSTSIAGCRGLMRSPAAPTRTTTATSSVLKFHYFHWLTRSSGFAPRAMPDMLRCRLFARLRHAKPPGEAWWTGQIVLTINRRSLMPLRSVFGNAQVAQLVEHATENRSVGGSIPPLGTIILSADVRRSPLLSWRSWPEIRRSITSADDLIQMKAPSLGRCLKAFQRLRNSDGGIPNFFRNAVLKCEELLKPSW